MFLQPEKHKRGLHVLDSDTCCLNFFSEWHDLEDSFECVNVSEDDVARRQAEEDLQLYGCRPQPSDAIDTDDSVKQAKAQPKRNLSDMEPTDDRPTKVRKIEEPESDAAPRVTAMDWNSGASPLDSWLNQSAIPSPSTTNQEPSRPPEKDLLAQEAEEIRAFRTVHIAMATEEAGVSAKHAIDKELASLPLGAQIYYRNIKDRYPDIPTFLARRLAEANHERAERLQCKRRRTAATSEQHEAFISEKGKYIDSITFRSFSQLKSHKAQCLSSVGPAKPHPDGLGLHRLSSLSNPADKQRIKKDGEVKAERRAEIERRCQSLQPPIEPSVLEHMISFQAAIQIPYHLTEDAWQSLESRLLAQRSDAETKERQTRIIRSVLPGSQICRSCRVGQQTEKTCSKVILIALALI